MSSGFVRRISREDIQLVQNLIERCLQLYMNPKEVVETLLDQAKIERSFTELVWQKLEEENEEFFRAYYTRLQLKEQITEFNKLLAEHAKLSQRNPTAVALLTHSRDSHVPALPQNPSCNAAEQAGSAGKPENMQHIVDAGLHNWYNNGGSSLHTSMRAAVEMSAPGNSIDSPSSMLATQSSSMSLEEGINGTMINSKPGYSGRTPHIFSPDGNVLEAPLTIGDASVTSFTTVDSNTLSMNEAFLDPNSFGVFEQIPGNFSLSDMTADFSESYDLFESYPRCPSLLAANENFLKGGKQG